MKNFCIFLLISISFTFKINKVLGQININGKIIGQSERAKNGLPSNIIIFKNNEYIKGISTDSSGQFRVQLLEKSVIKFQISSVGYKELTKILICEKDTTLQLELLPDAKILNEVEVKAIKRMLRHDLEKTTLEVKGNRFLIGKNLLQMIDYIPGIWIDPVTKNINLKGNSVTVYINDRKTTFSNDELNNYLSSLNYDNVKSIEVISNPPARYDAQGQGGIMNINLIKPVDNGFDASLNLFAKHGIYTDKGINLQLNSQIKNTISLYGNYGSSSGTDIVRWSELSKFLDSDRYQNFYQRNITNFNRSNYTIGSSIIMKKGNSINIEFFKNYYQNSGNLNSDGNFIDYDNIEKKLQSVRSALSSFNRTNFNVNYKKVIDTLGKQILIVADISNIKNYENTIYNNDYFNTKLEPLTMNSRKSDQGANYDLYSVRADYDYPISKSRKIETGVKYSYTSNQSSLDFRNLVDNIYIPDYKLSNSFQYTEKVAAIYGSYRTSFPHKIDAKFGLRLESTKGQGNSITLNESQNREYTNIFPSVFIQKNIGKEGNSLNFSYSNRINRPNFRYYNPFISYSTEFVSYTGNPNILPEYTNSFELDYNQNNGLNLGIYAKLSKNTIDEIQINLDDKNIRYQYRNLSNFDNIGFNANFSKDINKNWGISLFGNVYTRRYRSNFLDASPINTSMEAYFIRATNNVSVKGYNISFTGYYVSKENYGQRIMSSLYSFNLFANRSFLKSKLNLSISCEDIFNTYKERLKIQQQTLSTDIYRLYERRTISFAVRYNFKSGKKVNKSSKQTSNDEETRRTY